jgi:hypothetical protein
MDAKALEIMGTNRKEQKRDLQTSSLKKQRR